MRRGYVRCVRLWLHVDGQSTCIFLVTVQRWVNPMKQGIPWEEVELEAWLFVLFRYSSPERRLSRLGIPSIPLKRLQGFVWESRCHNIARKGNEVVVVAAADRSHRVLETLHRNRC